ncbi:fused MFS/spermidine synthase [Roseimaritima ulvae]|uniref:Spermidine synthase n=1 Tax=Roseimaritima ulvae TaxID=980254 RepID=A0A5B9QL21_9BACT|nr:fused MFS/spermidine synthase [Roseimaritima ulvae]QEG38462.1 spermidine synthase [Roseimaritima ulvae]
MPAASRRLEILPFIAATLLGAFLVFQVQPVISKTVLPWFGGSPAVWTTCMLFFQMLLFGGYLYAHLLISRVPRRFQGVVHAVLLMAAVLSLPIQPGDNWKPAGDIYPVPYLLALLAVHVGLPYFVLASTGPLVQAWLARRRSDHGVYRLYAYSNIGSLTALVSYPVLVEPVLAVDHQSLLWSLLFCGFALVQGVLALWLGNVANIAAQTERDTDVPPAPPVVKPSRYRLTRWLLLPALASVALLAVTNHVCQDVAVIPFLWVLPLGLYLLSFIICFDRPAWYKPRLYAWTVLGCLAGVVGLSLTPLSHWMLIDAGLHLTLLMALCMLCHGEVARLKPHPQRLTQYYLMLSAGGAMGGLVVGLLCPLLFTGYTELAICCGVTAATAATVLLGYRCESAGSLRFDLRRVHGMRGGLVLLALLVTWLATDSRTAGVQASSRNFFGVLRVVRMDDCVAMMHGRTMHGLQTHDAPQQATTYYGSDSGVGRVLQACARMSQLDSKSSDASDRGLNVAGVGLGCGTLATYGRTGDRYEFIEINPDVIRLAQQHFDFIGQSAADVQLTVGDGRLVLEDRADGRFDVIALDAFSSDSVPAHLLTREAFTLYRSCLKPQGVLVVHVTNRHLDLPPVVHRLAADAGLASGLIASPLDMQQHTLAAQWIVVTADEHPIWKAAELRDVIRPSESQRQLGPLWTDRYHDLLSVVHFRSR